MKLVTFKVNNEYRLGAIKGKWVVDIGRAISLLSERKTLRHFAGYPYWRGTSRKIREAGPAPLDMIALLERGEDWLSAVDDLLDFLLINLDLFGTPRGLLRPLAATRFRAPILRPGKITAVGLNYVAHAREQGKEPPTRPVFFLKSSNTICGPGDPIVLPPNSSQVDYEAEFAVVLGKRGRQIPEEKAYEYVAGYMILNDVTARDMQSSDRQWFRGKSCDTFAPTGPCIVTRDEVPDPHNLRISLTLNGQTMQDSNTRDLIFKIPYLVSYLSQSLTWEPGDILSTGTPGGVGVFRKPPVFLKAGDRVTIEIEWVGTLTNPVKAAS